MTGQRRGTAALPSRKQRSSRTNAIKGPVLGMEVALKRQTFRHVKKLIPISLLTIPTELLQFISLVLTHNSGRVTQICVFNTVKLGTSVSSP